MDFNTLLQRAQHLTSVTQGLSDLPPIERSIPQLLQETQEMHQRVTSAPTLDIQADTLLRSVGFHLDLQNATQKLNTMNLATLNPIEDIDVEGFLKNEKENAILGVFDEVLRNTHEDAKKRTWQCVQSEWRMEKIKLLNTLGEPSRSLIDVNKLTKPITTLNDVCRARSMLNRMEMAYARVVCDYNYSKVNIGGHSNLIVNLSKASERFDNQKVHDVWELIRFMVNVTPIVLNNDPTYGCKREQQFITQAKLYLEHRYKMYMLNVVCSDIRQAELGGVPSSYQLVYAFVGLKFKHKQYFELNELAIENRPLWPMVYYSLRCGDIQSALHCMQIGGIGHEFLVKILENKIQRSGNQRESAEPMEKVLKDALKDQYKNQTFTSGDAYQIAVYCILTGTVFKPHPDINGTTDDFLWLKLYMLRTDTDESGNEKQTYAQLQCMLSEQYGEKHFHAHEQPFLYFQVLALTGQFEAAIEVLSRTESNFAHAVHIALALNELYLINQPQSVQAPLLTVNIADPKPMRRLNIARLVMLYVKKFEVTDPVEAMHYLFFLRRLKDEEDRNLFLVCVSDMVIECRNYELIFGKVDACGKITTGLFKQFECVEFDTRSAAVIVAEELVRKGMFEDAIRMYDIAGMPDQALRYLSQMLSQVAYQAPNKNLRRQHLKNMSHEFSERLCANHIECYNPKIINTFKILCEFMKFFDAYYASEHQLAFEALSKTKLVPMSMDELQLCLDNFKVQQIDVMKVFPDVLVATMEMLFAEYKCLKCKKGGSGIALQEDMQAQFLREKAKAVVSMAAMMPYRMPGDGNKRLVQIEILMHQ